MILSFDKFERYELPQVTLCNPNSRATEVDGKITITDTVGVLSNPKGMNLKLNFNAPHELSFDYYRHKSSDPIKQSFYDSIYEAIQTDRYIYLTDIGYFIVSSVTDSDEDNIDKKSISCKSCEENELATAEGLHLKEGTYYLHTDNNDGLLDLFLPKTAGWTMGYIDPSLLTKPYFVEETEVDNGYNFLYTTTQDMFECIVEPNIIRRTISVYSRVYYAEHHLTDIHIAKYNLLKHKTVEENDEDKYTALNVQGKDENLEIRAVNPTGKNVIYNFEPRYSWMSPALQQAIEKWQEKCESVEDEYLTLQQGYYNDMQNIVFPLEKDIEALELQLKEKEQTRDTIIYGDYDKEKYDEIQDNALKQVNTEIQNVSTQISDKKAQLETEKNKIETNYSQPISNINSDCALDVTAVDIDGNIIFTTDLLNELMTHIKPTDYVDEYMLVTESMTYPQRFEKAKELMDRAQSQLVKISSGQKTYSIDTRSFLFNKQFRHFSEQLCAGAIIYVETKNDKMEQLHLTGIDINFDDKSTNFTLGNKYDRSDLKALYEDALGQNSKSFSELKYIAGIIEEQQKQLDYQQNWVADLRTLTLDNVLTSEDQAIEINNRGLIGRKRKLDENGKWDFDENGNPLFELEQVKLINNTLVFTENNWRTASTAVGKIAVGYNPDGSVKYAYGINGQVLIGELILGNNLVLTGTGAGIKIKDNNGNDAFYADQNGNLVLSGTIFAKDGNIGGWNIDTTLLSNKFIANVIDGSAVGIAPGIDTTDYSISSVKTGGGQKGLCFWAGAVYKPTHTDKNCVAISEAPFRVYNNGSLYASQGKIGGWHIGTDAIYGGDTVNGKLHLWAPDSTNGWVMATYIEEGGNLTTPFVLTKQGHLIATKATIRGDITATSGSFNGTITAQNGNIGGWNIGTNYLQGTWGSNYVTIKVPDNTSDTTFLDVCYNGEYPFVVTKTGHLTATDANITGTINAGSIIGGSTITSKNGYCKINYLFTDSGGVGPFYVHPDYLGTAYGSDYYNRPVEPRLYKNKVDYYMLSDGVWMLQRHASWDSIIKAGVAHQNDASDMNLKYDIAKISEQYEGFFDMLKPSMYKYIHGSSGRTHTGFIAQEVVSALYDNNLTTQEFAGIYLDDTEEYGTIWCLRRDEFVALNTWQIQRCKKRIADLETTVAELKTQIQTLTAG